MKLAITGKGGVGKTTITSLLAQVYASMNYRVIAIDANPDSNLATAMGFSSDDIKNVIPIAEMADLIEERTGAKPGTIGSIFKLNPKVDDLPEKYSIKRGNIMLLIMGTVKRGGAGCLCPESALLKSLTSYLVLRSSEMVIMDMDAGLEHLGRGTARAVDAFIIVVEPGQRSFQTARSIAKLAHDLDVNKLFIIGSKTKNERDRDFIRKTLSDFNILGFIDYDSNIIRADRMGLNVYETASRAVKQMIEIQKKIDESVLLQKGGL